MPEMRHREHIEPLATRRLFQTADLDEARAIVSGKFCDHRLNISGQSGRFDACHHRAEGYQTSLNYIRYGADVRIEPGELDVFYLIQIPLSGTADIDNCGGQIRSRQGLGSVLNPHRDTKMRWREGCTQLLLQIDANAMHSEAERVLGMTLSTPVTFETAVDEAKPATAEWVKTLKTCVGLTERGNIFAQTHRGTQMQIERQLISQFLFSQPSNVSALIAAAPSASANKHLKRAVRFIHANLRKHVTVQDIADAAGTSARSLQLFFQAEFALSPMQYVRLQRLALARTLILSSGRDETLGDIVFRAGISHLGRFSAEYRAQYGERPSETKKRAEARPAR